MTVVDDILDGLNLQSSVFSRMTLFGEWGFAKDALTGAPFHLILSGEAWLLPDELGPPIRLSPGDLVVLPKGNAHRLMGKPGAGTVPWQDVYDQMGFRPWVRGERYKSMELRLGTGDQTSQLISGIFAFGDHRRNPLFSALPSVLLLRSDADTPAAQMLNAIRPLLDAELMSGKPGAGSVGGRLADILFVQVVRHYLSSADLLPRGWLRGMADAEISPVLVLMQRQPGEPWTVASLARAAGMSRSRFASRFHEVIGRAPLDYLTDWRMYLAAGRLVQKTASLPSIAASVGYRSEVAFSKAFKRWAGQPPASYVRGMVNPHPSVGDWQSAVDL